MSFKYRLVANDDRASITVFADGELYLADSDSHSNINEIIRAAVEGDESVVELFDAETAINRKFERLSERVTISGGEVFLDGDPAPKALSDAIMDHHGAGLDFTALVEFLERMGNNPNPESVKQLYNWLEANDGFTITDDGYLIGYKGVAANTNGEYVSVRSGRAVVDGEEVTGRIPNYPGAVVEMPRSEVEFNPARGCSFGLHVGTYEYAKNWAQGALLEVIIDPRDVVSVPTDSGAQKLRTCRYTVLDVIDQPHTTPVRGYEPVTNYMDEWGDHEDDPYDNLGW